MLDRVVQINDLSDPKGGASKLAVLAACELRQRGHSVTFMTGDAGVSSALLGAGVDIVALGQQRLLASGRAKALVDGIWNRAAHRMVRQWILRHDTPGTVYHLHGWAQILSPSIFAALEPVRDRLVISAHDFFLACPNGAFAIMKSGKICPHKPLGLSCLTTPCDRNGSLQKAWRTTRQVVQRHAYRPTQSPPVLAIHNAMADYLTRCGIPADSVITVPNPVDPYSDARIPAEHNREVLFVGRLEQTKGADLAAAAAAEAGAPLTIIGDGPLAATIQALHPTAKMLGRCSPQEIRSHAAKARMLVVPSRYPEPFGLVAIEAAWSGLPILIADTALLSRDLVDSGAALAVNPRDTSALAKTIGRLCREDDTVHRMSVAAFERTRHLAFTQNQWVDRLESLFHARLKPESAQRGPGPHTARITSSRS